MFNNMNKGLLFSLIISALLVLIIYTLLVFSVKAASILENIFTDSIDKTSIKEAAQANLFCAS